MIISYVISNKILQIVWRIFIIKKALYNKMKRWSPGLHLSLQVENIYMKDTRVIS